MVRGIGAVCLNEIRGCKTKEEFVRTANGRPLSADAHNWAVSKGYIEGEKIPC